jgi:hypothetical protein
MVRDSHPYGNIKPVGSTVVLKISTQRVGRALTPYIRVCEVLGLSLGSLKAYIGIITTAFITRTVRLKSPERKTPAHCVDLWNGSSVSHNFKV